jgi:D-alanyl-D-alanine carboxypeptidase/D-alanyl-D-alanine-endopeptidase (penicillin-binding protein 4)
VAAVLLAAACSSSDTPSSSGTTVGTAPPGSAIDAGSASLPAALTEVMGKSRYADATWSLLVTDVETGETFYDLNGDQMSFTGSTRKLFSTGVALNELGADHRFTTPVHRSGTVDATGTLDGDLVLVASGDLTFGGRRLDADTVEITDFDHNDAVNLGDAELVDADPLYAVDDLAAQVKASGINSVSGDVVIDDRLFDPYRVPNGKLLITPMLLNENMVDVRVTPTEAGQPATVEYRPKTSAFAVDASVTTSAAGTNATVKQSDDSFIRCIGTEGCAGTISGEIPEDYVAPLTKQDSLVTTFRVEDPPAFARSAFIDALERHGVTVTAPAAAPNPVAALPAEPAYPADTQVASYTSPPFSQDIRLVLKVSLNLGANLSLSLFGLTQGERTIDGSLAAERSTLVEDYGVDGDQFDFPTNGSGSPDSKAAPRALVQMLTAMSKTPVAADYRSSLPVLGVDGSLATTGADLPGAGHVFAKTGTTVEPGADGVPQLKAQNLAGYIETKSGRTVAYALMVNDAGPLVNFAEDIGGVFTDEAVISSWLYENL